ncbi:hypothetical protein T492DRAFT_1018749 [Pavlovales sp. CCMP2436]|nr:hypothetical protein T492DRAFT_1018749 [Pavlovales sp. CCMP2436]
MAERSAYMPTQPEHRPLPEHRRRGPGYLFLDIDGVLLPFGGEAVGGFEFPRRCLDALASIMTAAGPQVVLSSTWRCDPHAVRAIREQLYAYGEPLASISLVACTDPSLHSERQWEIAAWLKAHAASGVDVTRFVVLDDLDCVDGKANQRHRPMFEHRCVLVESSEGLNDRDAEAAIAILARPARRF